MKRVQLEMAEREKEVSAAELAGLATELVGLRQELEAAREAAALVGLSENSRPFRYSIINLLYLLLSSD